MDILDDNGRVTQQYGDYLKREQTKFMRELDTMQARMPEPDLFGILRGRCEACGDRCFGYQPQGVVCPSPNNELDFPTFCQHCGCPACFHEISVQETSLPLHMTSSLQAFNITQNDINFNAVFVVFEIKKEKHSARNIGTLLNLLRGEGLEILSLEARALDIEEAMYLRFRQL